MSIEGRQAIRNMVGGDTADFAVAGYDSDDSMPDLADSSSESDSDGLDYDSDSECGDMPGLVSDSDSDSEDDFATTTAKVFVAQSRVGKPKLFKRKRTKQNTDPLVPTTHAKIKTLPPEVQPKWYEAEEEMIDHLVAQNSYSEVPRSEATQAGRTPLRTM